MRVICTRGFVLLALVLIIGCDGAPPATVEEVNSAESEVSGSEQSRNVTIESETPQEVVDDPTPTETAIPPTATAEPVPPATQPPPTETAVVPTATPLPTDTPQPAAIAEPTATPSPEPTTAPVVLTYNTILLLDASGSMLNPLGAGTRLSAAQTAIGNLSAALPSSMNASLWAYGHRVDQEDKPASCLDIEAVIPLGKVDPAQFESTAQRLNAKGWTPITTSLMQAAESFPIGDYERNTIVLVSDGEETCDGDPCALAAQLAASDAQVTIHAIGLAVDVTRAQLQCIAEAANGTYTDADSAERRHLLP